MDLRDAKYWYRSGAFTLLEKVALQVFRFGSVYLLVRSLPKSQYGIWVLFLAINACIEATRGGLIRNALVKFHAMHAPVFRSAINTASLFLNAGCSVLSVIGLVLIASTYSLFINKAEILGELLYLYAITTLLLAFFYQFIFIQQANFDFAGGSISHILREGTFFAYIVLHYWNGWAITLPELAQFQILAAFIGCISAWLTARKYLIFARKLERKWVVEQFHYGKFVMGTNMSTIFTKYVDHFLLGSLVSTSAVALYGIAIKIANLVEVPTQSISDIVFPQSAKRLEDEGKEAVRYLYERSVGVILALVIPGVIFVMCFPNFVVEVAAGPKYKDSVEILQVVMLSGLLVPFIRQFGTILDSIGEPQINFILVLVGGGLNIFLSLLFIPKYGIIGAAYGSLGTYALTFIVSQVILYKKLNVQFFYSIIYAHKFYTDSFSHTLGYVKEKLSKS